MSTATQAAYEQASQSQVLTFYPQLDSSSQSSFEQQLKTVDPVRVNNIYARALQAESEAASTSPADSKITPPPAGSYDTVNSSESAQWRAQGLKSVADGHVGVLLMAGGQGTRLGSSAPKGCYDISLPSHKSLFQLQAERIQGLQQLAGGATVPWYIMTSGPTRQPTVDFFKQHNFFGLNPENVIFFEQGACPSLPPSVDADAVLDAHLACLLDDQACCPAWTTMARSC